MEDGLKKKWKTSSKKIMEDDLKKWKMNSKNKKWNTTSKKMEEDLKK